MLKLVPFNPVWINHDKIDVHAIYRRPRFTEDKYGELIRDVDPKTGLPTWDLTGGLPVRAHTKWTSKGFEYVTLSNRESLQVAGRSGTIPGNWREYDQHQTGGPWSWKKYCEGFESAQATDLKELTEDVYLFGSVAVETLRRRQTPDFALPENLRGIAPGTAQPSTEPEQQQQQNRKKSAAA